MKENQLFVKGQRVYSTWRKKFYIVTKVDLGRIRVLLEGTSNLRYWVAMGRARKIFIPAEEAAEQSVQPTPESGDDLAGKQHWRNGVYLTHD